jgi:proline dehydrogenase
MTNLNQYYRQAVLGVAGIPSIKHLVEQRGWMMAKRFVAGEHLADALAAAERLEQQGIHGILDLLGEMVIDHQQARGFTDEILQIFPHLTDKPGGYVSIKLSQLGLDLSQSIAVDAESNEASANHGPYGFVLENARKILRAAQAVGCFVRIDMEDSPRIDATLAVFRQLRQEFSNVGLVIQSCLYRSEADVEQLNDLAPNLRIVKGAYLEPKEVAYASKHAVDMNYLRLVYKQLLAGHYTCVATHDERIIEHVKLFAEASKINRERFEFQLLYGVRRDLQQGLAKQGYTVRAYIPYGRDWYAYFSRRIAERPANVMFVLRGMMRA